MILVDELVEWTPSAALVRARVRVGGPFVRAGRLPATILLEYMAQAIAVAEGMGARASGRAGGGSEAGVLLGTRELELEVEEVAVGETLDIAIEQKFADMKLASYACEVRSGARRLAAATVNVMVSGAVEVSA
ncbi:hypothetical protein ENSA5_13060 [Enhygromyxa salina]|uniref:Uncharacterized protein n=2 Tax=Enhygromyxa salina TaxID=215803 RepID=A0A2S9YEY5_9BACT|nr:hypothetical protein ENSA5_13060 [Enhygromyxa salina]